MTSNRDTGERDFYIWACVDGSTLHVIRARDDLVRLVEVPGQLNQLQVARLLQLMAQHVDDQTSSVEVHAAGGSLRIGMTCLPLGWRADPDWLKKVYKILPIVYNEMPNQEICRKFIP